MAAVAGAMSKHDKAKLEAVEIGHEYAGPDSAARSEPATRPAPESLESRQFNIWLDRALPLLQQQLSTLGTISVTAPPGKTKH